LKVLVERKEAEGVSINIGVICTNGLDTQDQDSRKAISQAEIVKNYEEIYLFFLFRNNVS